MDRISIQCYDRDRKVRFTESLEDGAEVGWRAGGVHEEGFEIEYYTLSRDGETISLDVETRGRDCDGPIHQFRSLVWRHEYGTDSDGFPNWQHASTRFRP